MWISKKKYKELEDKIKELERKVKYFDQFNFSNLYCDINDFKRIFERSKLGEITYWSYFDKSSFMYALNKNEKSHTCTYIYFDFKEYKIDGLYLYDPKFISEEDNKNIIHIDDKVKINDEFTIYQYTVDLKNKNYIQTK